jgi:hypothetical protein
LETKNTPNKEKKNENKAKQLVKREESQYFVDARYKYHSKHQFTQ